MLAASVIGSPSLPVGLLLLVASFIVAVPLTGRLARLVQPVFATNPGIDRHHLIGRTCTVRTGRVDEGFGQAEVLDADGASHLIHVRCVVPTTSPPAPRPWWSASTTTSSSSTPTCPGPMTTSPPPSDPIRKAATRSCPLR